MEKEVSDLTGVFSMSENEIRESLVTSKEWKKDLKSFQDLKEKFDIEMVSLEIEPELSTSYN